MPARSYKDDRQIMTFWLLELSNKALSTNLFCDSTRVSFAVLRRYSTVDAMNLKFCLYFRLSKIGGSRREVMEYFGSGVFRLQDLLAFD